MSIVLDHREHAQLIEAFAQHVPRLLAREPLTSGLAAQVERLARVGEEPFTLAVVGQMRAGKSTLLNAIVGKDLAVTGVNETTATVNWFKHAMNNQCGIFRVHWRERPPEDFPISEIQSWVGNSERAADTRFLEFFDDAEFLREVFIVDTPGTRSVLSAHEAATQEFLAEKRERETLLHGGAADAILYVLMPVARETDDELLRSFERTTRLPGSSPYNSVAVIHKWETIEAPDPLAEAKRKAERIAARLHEHVCAVLPVSGPLALAAQRLPDAWWETIVTWLRPVPAETIERLVGRGEEAFCRREMRDVAPPAEREAVLRASSLPWPCFRGLLSMALRRQIDSPQTLRALASEMGGKDALLELLQSRFFARTRLIKSFSLLSRALEPCLVATGMLRQRSGELQRLNTGAVAALACLGMPVRAGLEDAERFVIEAKRTFNDEAARLNTLERELAIQVRTVREAFEQLNADAECLRLLDEGRTSLSSEVRLEARRILGSDGSSLAERCRGYEVEPQELAAHLTERLDYWQARAESAFSDERRVAEQVAARLGELLDFIDSSTPLILA